MDSRRIINVVIAIFVFIFVAYLEIKFIELITEGKNSYEICDNIIKEKYGANYFEDKNVLQIAENERRTCLEKYKTIDEEKSFYRGILAIILAYIALFVGIKYFEKNKVEFSYLATILGVVFVSFVQITGIQGKIYEIVGLILGLGELFLIMVMAKRLKV